MKNVKTKDKVTEYLLGRISALESFATAVQGRNADLEKSVRELPDKELAIKEMQENEVVFDTITKVTSIIYGYTEVVSKDILDTIINDIRTEFGI